MARESKADPPVRMLSGPRRQAGYFPPASKAVQLRLLAIDGRWPPCGRRNVDGVIPPSAPNDRSRRQPDGARYSIRRRTVGCGRKPRSGWTVAINQGSVNACGG